MESRQCTRSRKEAIAVLGYTGIFALRYPAVSISLLFCSLMSSAASQSSDNSVSNPADSAGFFVQGQKLAEADRLAEAEVKLEEAAKFDPSNLHVLTLLAKVKARLGESKQAVILFQRVVIAEPSSATAHSNLAIALADSGEIAASLGELRRSISLDPKSAGGHLNLARVLSDSKDLINARIEFKKASVLAPGDPNVYLYWAISEKDSHHCIQAIPLFKRAVQLQPDNTRALFSLGNCLHELSRDAEAVAAWRRVIGIDPMFEEALYALAITLRSTDSSESTDFLRQFESVRAARQNNDQAIQLGNKAFAAMEGQDWRVAIETLQEAIRVCNHCPIKADLHQRLGLAMCHQGDLQAGEIELRKALELNPKDRVTVTALEWVSKQKSSLSPTH